MTTDGYYRFPTIHNETIVFVSEDDLWTVPAKGGTARRLTANLGRVSHPALSPDGQWLAFIGREDGENEVYVMPAEGGSAIRLTYLGSQTTVLGWTPEGQIIFASDAGQPFPRLTPLHTISPEGGSPQPLPYGPARMISYGPERGVVIGRRASDLANWKRYRGGRTGDIWLDSKGNGRFKRLLKKVKGNLISPMWLGEQIYFLSDHEGIANLYSCTIEGKKIQRHTHHEDFYIRNPATDGRRIVYRAGGDLYLFDPTTDKTATVDVQYYSPRVQRHRKFVKAAPHMTGYALHPKGHSVALTVRGKSFAMSNWEGAVVQQGEAQGVRYRLTRWLNDGRRLITVSDAGGEECLEIHTYAVQMALNGQMERLEGLDIGRPLFLKVSPTADSVIFSNHRFELLHLDLKSKELRILDKSDNSRIRSADWSPDGRWVAYTYPTSLHTTAIKLCHVETGDTHFVTAPHSFYDFGPSFDPGGKYLYFISFRDFDPVSDSYYFDLNFPRGGRPYLVTLRRDLSDPFIPLPNGIPTAPPESSHKKSSNNDDHDVNHDNGNRKDSAEGETDTTQKETDKPEERTTPELHIDVEGIQNRISAFPVGEGRYYQIRGIHKGKALYTMFPLEGSLNRSWRNDTKDNKGTLEMYDLTERKKETVVGGISSFGVSRDRNFIIYRSYRNVRILKAGEKPDNNAAGFNKKSGWLDLNRVRVAVSPPHEWQQMFREAWRLQRDHFWTEDMSSIDWQRVYERYYPLLERVASRAEFSDLLWEMQGELGTSHAYEIGGDYRTAPGYHQGFLGADFEYDAEAKGYRLTHIVQGDSWSERFDSPLNRLGVNAEVGDILVAIDGQRLSESVSPQEMLVNRANTEVQLTLVSRNGTSSQPDSPTNGAESAEETADSSPTYQFTRPRTVLVKTDRSETRARYREWVETNRRRVHQDTDGRVGYLHVPDMGAFGYAEFHRYYLAESEREGLIVDVRFNGGGNVSQLLLEKLARRRLGYKKPRYGQVRPYPLHSVLGPLVALTNEYAGSDGDIFCHAFKLLELGPLIGKRTWGGVIGISPSHALVDGTYTTQPEYSSWFEDVGWAVENYGTDPDIEVEMKPQDYAKGKDPQLERAIKEIMKLMEKSPPTLPDFGPPPNLTLPTLPKRKK